MTDASEPTDEIPPVESGWRRRLTRPVTRWLVAGGVAVLAAGVGIALAVQSGAASACAAALSGPPVGGAVHKGSASYYDSRGSGGNCSFPSAPTNHLYVALGNSEYAAGAACGGYLDVTGPKGTVRVLIMDQCGGCQPGKIDLSKQAFAKIADLGQGIVPVSYRAAVNPPLPGPLTFRFKDGASQYWFAVQVGNHGNPLKSVEAKPAGGGWRATARQDYNYWIVDKGLGPGPYSIRVTDVYGHQAVVPGIRLVSQKLQTSAVRLYGAPATPAVTAPAARPTAQPTVSATDASPSPAGPSGTPSADPVALAAAGAPAGPACGS